MTSLDRLVQELNDKFENLYPISVDSYLHADALVTVELSFNPNPTAEPKEPEMSTQEVNFSQSEVGIPENTTTNMLELRVVEPPELILRVSAEGVHYRGELAEDAGQAYQMLTHFLQLADSGNQKSLAQTIHEVVGLVSASTTDKPWGVQPWSAAPDWCVESTYEAIQLFRDNPETSEFELHERWMKTRMDEGWTYGPVKDTELKTNPALLPMEQLPPMEALKCRLIKYLVVRYYHPKMDLLG